MAVSESKKRKLFHIAKELNISSHTIREFLEKKGFSVRNPNMVIPEEMYSEILKRFSHEKKEAEKVEKRRLARKKEERIVEVKKETVIEDIAKKAAEEIAEPGEPEAEEVVDEKVKEPEPVETAGTKEGEQEEEPVTAEAETKPVPPSGKEELQAEAAAEDSIENDISPEVEKPEKPLADETTEGEITPAPEAPVKEKKTRVGDIIDHPMAKQYLEKKKAEEELKKKRQKKILKKIKSVKEEETPEVSAEAMTADTGLVTDELGVEKKKKERKKDKKKDKKKEFLDLQEDKEARRKKAFEMLRKESKKFRTALHELDTEEGGLIEKEKESRKKKSKKKKEIDQKEVEDVLKKTLAEMSDAGTGRKKRKKVRGQGQEEEIDENVIKVTEFITTQDLANLMDVSPAEIIQKCLELGLKVTINQRLDMDTIHLLAEEFGFSVEEEEEFGSEYIEDLSEEEESPEDLVPRHPVVTVMGHVDHGKTSLLDYIRKANVIAGESGGITQHIGAYQLEMKDGRYITFIDTPGHEAFTAMRARGAQVTDIVVLVIAADDRVMPQTDEAIDHAKAAGVPILIAINKVDKPNANPEAIKKDLADRNILVEDWGGPYQVVEVSAKTGQNIDELLEKIQLEAEMLDLKANPRRRAKGVVLEARLDKGKGAVATVLVQDGTLKIGDYFIVGQQWGRVRALLNERGQRVKSAGPSSPVQILGITGTPEAGDKLIVMADEKTAKEVATRRQQLQREQDFHKVKLLTLDDVSRQIKAGTIKELRLLIKADVDGSAQALVDSLLRLSTGDVDIHVIRRALGPITESDVMLAAASNAVIIGFHVRPSFQAKELAEREHVDIRLYKIIYDVIADIEKVLEGMLEPIQKEVVQGTVEVRETFKISRMGTVAGCYVLDGKITRNSRVRLIRNDVEVYDGKLASLKRFKEDVKEVLSGFECGLMIENFNDIKVGDIIEAYEVVQEAQTLDKATSH